MKKRIIYYILTLFTIFHFLACEETTSDIQPDTEIEEGSDEREQSVGEFTINIGMPIDITDSTARITGEFVFPDLRVDVLELGHCWATHTKPTVDDFFTKFNYVNSVEEFTSNLINLIPDKKYYIKGYAKVSVNEKDSILYTENLVEFIKNKVNSWNLFINSNSKNATFVINDIAYCVENVVSQLNPNANNLYAYNWQYLEVEGKDYVLSFSTSSKGYIITDENELWEFNPETKKWTRMSAFQSQIGYWANSFTISNNTYVITGVIDRVNGEDIYNNEMWEYNPTNDTWTKKTAFPSTPRKGAFSLNIAEYGYYGTGYNEEENTLFSDFWQYNPQKDEWIQKIDYPHPIRDACSFTILNRGFVGTGHDNINDLIFNDFWEYSP